MIIQYHPWFKENLRKFPRYIQEKFYKQAEFLLRDIRHPSLRVKKYDESNNVWQARVDVNVRFYFKIKNNIYFLLNIKRHPK
ncbi:MAG: hypothetical protein HYW34_03555 [Candidatus Brennerbacteria bacterium]|nr:hypothetical protein [Candidatus Brennerbacteria bacterium]